MSKWRQTAGCTPPCVRKEVNGREGRGAPPQHVEMEVNGGAGRVAPPPCVETEVNAGGEGGVASPLCVEMEVNGRGGDEQVEMGKEGPHSRRKYVGEGTTLPCLCRNPSKM